MATVNQKLGIRVRKLRKDLGLSQEKLAAIAKIDYTYLNMIEGGKKNPSIKRVTRLARALKISLPELFSFDKKRK